MGRQPCCDSLGLKRGPWTIEEDHKLANFILHNGIQCWRTVPKLAGLERCGKSCRLRWINYLRPDLKRGALSETEEDQIIHLHAHLGNRWSKIASHFPGRTDNEIKNHWNTRIKKRLKLMGIDPLTHTPINSIDHENQVEPSYDFDLLPRTEPYDKRNKAENSHGNANQWNISCKTMSCYSPSLSLEAEESTNFSTATESSSNLAPKEEQDSLQQWMDSIFSCAVNQLEDDMFILTKFHQ